MTGQFRRILSVLVSFLAVILIPSQIFAYSYAYGGAEPDHGHGGQYMGISVPSNIGINVNDSQHAALYADVSNSNATSWVQLGWEEGLDGNGHVDSTPIAYVEWADGSLSHYKYEDVGSLNYGSSNNYEVWNTGTYILDPYTNQDEYEYDTWQNVNDATSTWFYPDITGWNYGLLEFMHSTDHGTMTTSQANAGSFNSTTYPVSLDDNTGSNWHEWTSSEDGETNYNGPLPVIGTPTFVADYYDWNIKGSLTF